MDSLQSRRIVLATVGSRGDVQPMLALAQALAARGAVPVIAAPPNFRTWTTSLGFEFAPVGIDIQEFLAGNTDVLTGNAFKAIGGIKRYFLGQMPVQIKELTAACQGADAMLWSGLAFVAPSVAQHLRLPCLAVLYTSCMLESRQHPPPSAALHGLPGWVNGLLWRIHEWIGNRLILAPLNGQRAALGLPALPALRPHVYSSGSVVVAADEHLFPADPAWQGHYAYANYIFFDDPAPLDPALDAWLAEGEPPVFVGFGSMGGEGTDRVGRMIVQAVSATGRRCIVGAGWAGLGQGALPTGWRVVREAPHAQLFPRMAAVVHHGGSGTTAAALRAGVPQVILPLILDQYHHAHRLFKASLATRPVRMERVTANQLTAAIRAALALPEQPRLAAAQRLRASDGRGEIVRRVEALLAGNLPR